MAEQSIGRLGASRTTWYTASRDGVNERVHRGPKEEIDVKTRLAVRVARKPAEIAVDHIRTISKARIGAKLGALSAEDAAALRRLITDMQGSL